MRSLELLAPAKNADQGIAAIDHGADAVYIGAPRFGARAAAGNSVDDIRRLTAHAHIFGARVYTTLNTIVYEQEMEEVCQLASELQQAGVDAFLVQDMGLAAELRRRYPDIVLHASTQTDNRTAEKVGWLQHQGFERAVLARELSLDEIAEIHHKLPDMELEVFVHGALCVSYSGLCYASQHCFGRSANRGACAQMCRMKYDLVDSDGKTIITQSHLLSLKDLCLIDHLEDLADAGAISFKIEGRLKDMDYVKNVVSAYSIRLDEIISKRPEDFCRASYGHVEKTFTPDLKKTFNRGYTTYFLTGHRPDIYSPHTPKAIGERVGRVKEISRGYLTVAGTSQFSNGDGLCFINKAGELEGFRVNRAVANKLFPFQMPRELKPGLLLYRNNDEQFRKELSGITARRFLSVSFSLKPVDDGYTLEGASETGARAVAHVVFAHEQARQSQHENIVRQLSKLGDTPFRLKKLEAEADDCFIPSSLLSTLRRQVVEGLLQTAPARHVAQPQRGVSTAKFWQPEYKTYPYIFNVANTLAEQFYREQGLEVGIARQDASVGPLLMQCRHCLRFSLGHCLKHGGKPATWHEPLYLRLGDGRRFRLEFKCNECQMNIYAE